MYGNLNSHVVEHIKTRIFSGELRPGQKINESEIAQSLDISKSPVREAISLLESSGLIVTKPRRGAFVVEFTRKDVQEIYQTRAAIESYATRNLKGVGKDKIKKICRMMDMNIKAAKSHDAEALLGSDFHSEIVNAVGNHRLCSIYATIRGQSSYLRSVTTNLVERMDQSPGEHEKIKAAILDGDFLAAGLAMEEHIHNLAECYLNLMRR